MSNRPSTFEIINKGTYLDPDFDATSLTIPQLVGIFQYHKIKLPPQHNKAKLVDAYNKEIKRNLAYYIRERTRTISTEASEDGIIDGVSGLPLSGKSSEESKMPARRSSRRLSKEPMQEEPQPEPPKRRRSSAQPTLGGPSKKKPAIKQPSVIEESESEEDQVVLRKVVRRSKDSDVAGRSTRRVSQKFGPGTEDSGWEENNVFQSGPESSSPIRPLQKKIIRKSTSRKPSRKSYSEPPQNSSPPRFNFYGSPQTNKFDPDLPEKSGNSPGLPHIKKEPEHLEDLSAMADVSADLSGEVIEEEDEENEEDVLEEDESGVAAFTEKLQDAASTSLVRTQKTNLRRRTPVIQRTLLTTLLLAVLGFALQYKLESSPIGYCKRDSQSNNMLEKMQKDRLEIEACHALRISDEDIDNCPSLPLLPFHPESCTPCPEHASCTRTEVICDDGFLLRHSPLSILPSGIFDGMPGLGPVAFPPSCVEDPMRKRNIGALGRGIDSILAIERGKRICAGEDKRKYYEGGEAQKWGLDIEKLKEDMKKKAPPRMTENFDILFGEAVQQLIDFGRIIKDTDSEGRLYLATEHVDMSWNCQVTVAVRNTWNDWQRFIYGLTAFVLFGLYGRVKMIVKRDEDRRVSELVDLAMDTLRNQELAHHTDPITTPVPYLSSVQLRDLVLQGEHSIPTRRRLWARVEKLVEGNTNVRTNMQEVPGGDELRVWRWVGTSGRPRQIHMKDEGSDQRRFVA